MILLTVGSQLRFDRLVSAVDTWAAEAAARADGETVFAQVGETDAPPRHCEWVRDLAPDAFDARVDGARLVVGHAGTGTIMAALSRGKPVVVLARREALGETRNDHQVATLERFRPFAGFYGTVDETEIGPAIEHALTATSSSEVARPGAPALAPFASGPIVERLKGFLDEHLP